METIEWIKEYWPGVLLITGIISVYYFNKYKAGRVVKKTPTKIQSFQKFDTGNSKSSVTAEDFFHESKALMIEQGKHSADKNIERSKRVIELSVECERIEETVNNLHKIYTSLQREKDLLQNALNKK